MDEFAGRWINSIMKEVTQRAYLSAWKLYTLNTGLSGKDLIDKKHIRIERKQSLEDIFKCSEIKTLEKLVNVNYMLPTDILNKIRGIVEKNRPALMQGLKAVRLDKNNREVASIFIVPWQGFKVTRDLGSKNEKYKLIATPVENRLLSMLIFGIEEYVDELRIKIGFRSQEAKDENIFGIVGTLHTKR